MDLRVDCYQFSATSDDFHDRNWLIVAGSVRSGGEQWSFRDPCMLTDEAAQLTSWLRRAAGGQVTPAGVDASGQPETQFDCLEPNVAWGVAAVSGAEIRLRVHFRLESAPPSNADDGWGFSLELPLTRDDLLRAADEWEQELRAFPPRV